MLCKVQNGMFLFKQYALVAGGKQTDYELLRTVNLCVPVIAVLDLLTCHT